MVPQPAQLRDFKVAGALGSGATARVYDAIHIESGQPVAIKVLEPSESSGAGSELRERFAREAELLGSVSSQHVGRILSFGFERGQPFLVLERLQGETLDAKLRRDGPVPVPLAVRWIEQLLLGVRDCHERQIIHRDIKPSNIFLHQAGGREWVKLIDFGVARLREIAGDLGGLTASNHLIGSMGYMAPEQYSNAKSVDFTADLYTVGVVIFRTLTGRLPFVSRSLETVVKMQRSQPPPKMSSMANMPESPLLDAFVDKALARDPRDRFPSAVEMLQEWRNVVTRLALDGERPIEHTDPIGTPLVLPQRRNVQVVEPLDDEMDDRTVLDRIPEVTLDIAPTTVPDPTPTDPFDTPTRNDHNLGKRVQRELELHRKRNPSSK